MSEVPAPTDDGWYGNAATGVYVSRLFAYALKYAFGKAMQPGDVTSLFVLRIAPGREFIATKYMGPRETVMDGYDSHASPNMHEWWLPFHGQSVGPNVFNCCAGCLPRTEHNL